MAKEAKKTIRCKMNFPQKIVGQPVMHKLWHDFMVVSNTMRGRITEKGAFLEVELTGTPKNLEKALKFLAEQGVDVSGN